MQQRWQDMVDSQDLCKELGAGWPDRRSRLPNSWRSVLNDTQCSNYARLGQPRLLDKHPELLGVIQKTDNMHAEERKLLAPASKQGFLDTLRTQLQLAREQQADAGEAAAASSSALPSKVSRSWVQTQLRGLKAQEVKKPCTQPNVVTDKDKADYIAGLKRKLAKIADVRLQLAFDGFSATVDDGASRVLLHRNEATKQACRGNRLAQVKRCTDARQTMTAGICFSLVCKLMGLLVFSKCPRETLSLIRKDFGALLHVHVTSTGSVHGQFHVETVIPGVVAASAQRSRDICKVPSDRCLDCSYRRKCNCTSFI